MAFTFVEAAPDAGFNYPYYLHVPDAFEADRPKPILVEPTNTGKPTDEFEEHREVAKTRVEGGTGRRIAEELSIPFLHPVFPRPFEKPVDWTHSVHGLDAETLGIENGPLERVDLQLLEMIEDAKERLSEQGYAIRDRFIMNGFSASAVFANRFAALHPEKVLSVSAGGTNGMAVLPIKDIDAEAFLSHADIGGIANIEKWRLNYPVGIANIEKLTGKPFDLGMFREVNQFLYLGEDDDSDSLLYPDAWTDTDLRMTAVLVYGSDIHDERFPRCKAFYDEVDAAAVFRTYEDTGHTPSPAESDIVEFHERSLAGDDIEAIRADLGGNVAQ